MGHDMGSAVSVSLPDFFRMKIDIRNPKTSRTIDTGALSNSLSTIYYIILFTYFKTAYFAIGIHQKKASILHGESMARQENSLQFKHIPLQMFYNIKWRYSK
jgi:hypothetical protein